MKTPLISIVLLLISSLGFSQTDKCLAPTPPMGWNSWNFHGKENINESIIIETIDAIVESGLREAGYEYIIIDGGWRTSELGPEGELVVHPQKFPNGIKPLADYAHSKGLKFGLHTVPGTHDCGKNKVGGLGHEEVHIKQFVDWSLDFVKVDKCEYSLDENPDYPRSDKRWKKGWEDENTIQTVYENWSNLLENCGRDILFSISAYKYRDWYPQTCNMARTTPDIKSKKSGGAEFDGGIGKELKQGGLYSVMEVASLNNLSAEFAGNCYWNDPDMLAIGNQGLTTEQQKVHFALWCIMTSPLILGNDPRNMSDEETDMISNELAISINQDPCEQGKRLTPEGKSEIWGKKLSNGNMAFLLLNRDTTESAEFNLKFTDYGFPGKVKVTNVYKKEILTKKTRLLSATVKPQSGIFILVE